MKIIIVLFAALTISCAAGVQSKNPRVDLGLIPIGAAPNDITIFKSSNCKIVGRSDFSDCAAMDHEGRRYVFFDGALSRLSAHRNEVAMSVTLPAGMQFGESIEVSKNKAEAKFGVPFDRAFTQGRVSYASDFSIRSNAGVLFSMELIGNSDDLLIEVIQRTDF